MIVRNLRPTFPGRRSLLVLGTVVVGLAFPAASMAAKATDQITTAGVTKAKGFKLSLDIKQGQLTGYGGRYPNSVLGLLNKTNGHATQSNQYTFSSFGGRVLKFKGSKDLSSASMKGTFAKGRGSINMTFHATGKEYRVKLPHGCQGNGGYRRLGTLKGTYKLHADNLGTITVKSFKATLSTTSFTCNKPTHGYDVQTIGGNPYVDIFKPSSSGAVTETIYQSSSGNGFAFIHEYIAKNEPSSAYSVGSGLKKATIKGVGGISGSASYTSKQSNSHHTTGTVSGSLAVTMATIGKVTAFPSKRSAKQSKT